MRITSHALCGTLLLAAASNTFAGSVDAKLLDMLLANGSITKAQHTELMADLKKDERRQDHDASEKVDKKEWVAYQQLAGWAANTKLTGDMRVREEIIAAEEGVNSSGVKDSEKDRDRQRVRARLGAITQVNPQVEVGIQIATGTGSGSCTSSSSSLGSSFSASCSGRGSDPRSTNQDLTNYFEKHELWLDLGYIDYHPVQVSGLKLFAGKMKQPWIAIADMAWDTDINPEGFAAQYVKKMGTNTLTTSASYMILKDNVDGEGFEWDHDLSLFELQAAYAFDVGSNARLLLGATLNEFNNETQKFGAPTVALRANGNTTDTFRLAEGFTQLDVIGLPVPLSLYGQYIVNTEARDLVIRDSSGNITGNFADGGEDTAWLVGFRTNIGGIAFDYSYRDVERNAVVGTLTDSDFGDGRTGAEGHKLKAQYDFLKNYFIALTYFLNESETLSSGLDDADYDRIQIDLNARF